MTTYQLIEDSITIPRVRVYGVAWFAGSAIMGLLYDHSVMALVVFGMVFQLAAAAAPREARM